MLNILINLKNIFRPIQKLKVISIKYQVVIIFMSAMKRFEIKSTQ